MERMISRCFTWFPNCLVLGEPNLYHNLGDFTRMWGFYLEGSEYGLDYWGDFGKKFRIIRKEDKLNYKI